jgi:hypothetical protein
LIAFRANAIAARAKFRLSGTVLAKATFSRQHRNFSRRRRPYATIDKRNKMDSRLSLSTGGLMGRSPPYRIKIPFVQRVGRQ